MHWIKVRIFYFLTLKSSFLCQNHTSDTLDYLSGTIRSCIFSCSGELVFSLSFSSIFRLLYHFRLVHFWILNHQKTVHFWFLNDKVNKIVDLITIRISEIIFERVVEKQIGNLKFKMGKFFRHFPGPDGYLDLINSRMRNRGQFSRVPKI